MPQYMVGGYQDRPVHHLVSAHGRHGVDLPEQRHHRWKIDLGELDAVQRDVVAQLREYVRRDAVPEALREPGDRRLDTDGSAVGWAA